MTEVDTGILHSVNQNLCIADAGSGWLSHVMTRAPESRPAEPKRKPRAPRRRPTSLATAAEIAAKVAASTHKQETGARLRQAIEALYGTYAEAARKFEVSETKLNNWMRGDHYPDPYFLMRYCDRHDLTMDWFYRGRLGGVAARVAELLGKATAE